ncbi:hypothetical protein FRC12_007783 [Ceratobasidium sp. 428]|nr:hypothetical protein FRC12_007783 [Ceratobasidium sp. 428]
MSNNLDTARKENARGAEVHRHRFTTPLRRAFKRLQVTRKPHRPGAARSGTGNPLTERSNYFSLTSDDARDADEQLEPPPAPRPSRWASPINPPSPISPLPATMSRSSNILTVRSGMLSTSASRGSIRGFIDSAPSSSSPAPMPRGDLFQLGLTPVHSVRSAGSVASRLATGGPLFAPALPTAQRVSTVNIASDAAEIDIIDMLDMDTDPRTPQTPHPSRTTTGRWRPSLSIERYAGQNPSTTAVFESGNAGQPRRASFMSKLVGNAWGLAGFGFTSINPHRHTQPVTVPPQPIERAMSSLPSIPQGNHSIEQAVFGPGTTTSRLSTASGGSRRHQCASELPPANSTSRMTGSKSGRALDHLSEEADDRGSPADFRVKIEERPKKKRRSCAGEQPTRLLSPSSPSTRVTRSMATRQVEVEASSPTRVTRSTSKRLAELANGPAGSSCDGVGRRSKSLKRL